MLPADRNYPTICISLVLGFSIQSCKYEKPYLAINLQTFNFTVENSDPRYAVRTDRLVMGLYRYQINYMTLWLCYFAVLQLISTSSYTEQHELRSIQSAFLV